LANCMSSGGVNISSSSCGGVAGVNNDMLGDSYWKRDGTAGFNLNAVGSGSGDVTMLPFGAAPGTFAAPHPTYATTSLLDALNAWVDAANTAQGEDIYLHWTLDGSPDGYPVLDQSVPAVTPPSDYWSDEQNRDTSWGATLSDPMPIGTAEELAQFAWLVNQGNNFAGKTVLLTKDVDLSGRQWTPVWATVPSYPFVSTVGFSGTFDGGGHTISGMTIHASNTVTHAGLFGTISAESVVCNVNLVDTDITVLSEIGDIRAGGVVGLNNYGIVANCQNSGSVSASFGSTTYAHCGGIVGLNEGTVKDCANSGAVSASCISATIGGVVGLSDHNAQVVNCQNRGVVSTSCTQYSHCGGVVGWNRSSVVNCWSSGSVTSFTSSSLAYLGGVTGENGVMGLSVGLTQDSYWIVNGTAGFNRPAIGMNYGMQGSRLFSVSTPPGAFAAVHPTYATTSLLDALNGWVDAQGAGDYRHWTLEGSPDGYPVLCSEVQPPTPSTFTVEFISTALNGSGTMEPQTFTNGVAQNLTLNAFTYPCTAFATPVNFPFLGWGTNATYTLPMFTDGESLNLTGAPDITLYTAWGAVTDDDTGFIANPDGSVITDDGSVSPDGSMTVTLDPAGGDFGVTSVVCTGYTYNGLPTDGTRSGFIFTGWETTTGIPVVNGMPFHQARFAATLIAQWVSATEPDISDIVAPTPTVGVTYRGQVIMGMHAVPSSLSAKQLPSGLKLNSSSGEITGVPKKEGIYTVTVRATSLANRKVYTERVFSMVVAPLPARAIGTFDGYLDGEDTHGAVNLGNVTLTASASGKASAKVVAAGHGTQSISIPAWDSLSNGVLRATAVSAKGVPLAIGLDTTAEFGTWQLTGVFGGIPALAQRSPLKVKADPDFAIAQEALAAYMGYYTIGIRGDTVLEQGPSGTIPEGLGYLSTTVGTKPTLKFAGRLADGTAISGAYPIAFGEESAFVSYFTPLYKTEGYHSGLLEIDPLLTVTGEGRWTYPGASPTAKAPLTADRFTLSLLLSGGPYTPTAATLEAYSQGGPLLMFGAPEAGYTYTKGTYSVTAGPLGLPSELSLIGDKKGLLILPPDNPALATFKVTPSTGVFKGKLTVYYEYPDEGGVLRLKGVSARYQGILTPLGDFGAGAGYYLLDDVWQDISGAKPVTYKIKRSAPVVVEAD
ncbi:MAG: Ig domain-containing protein, partial [Kiritimatiellaeota bacterium]|nr:Ig domain-containing protein [Kiritimatiellota bacterium]